MCTLIIDRLQHPTFALTIAANRDESRGRPASPPRRWTGEGFLAPIDDLAGGTWLGLTQRGLFVGVTNRYPSPRFPERSSRGQLVVEALRAGTAQGVRERLEGLKADRFNTFHLLYTDATAGYVTWSDGERIHHDVLPWGLTVVTERSLGGDDHGRAQFVADRWPQLPRRDALVTTESMMDLLATGRPDDPAAGVCVDVPGLDYGTRSSLVLTVGKRLADSRWYWAEGRPDRTPFVERPELIESLLK